MVTVEAALAIAVLAAVVALGLSLIRVGMEEARVHSAAREAARLAARGEHEVAVGRVVQALAPGAHLSVADDAISGMPASRVTVTRNLTVMPGPAGRRFQITQIGAAVSITEPESWG